MVVILSQKKTTLIVKLLLTVVFFNIEFLLFTNGCKIFSSKHVEGYTVQPQKAPLCKIEFCISF